METEFDAAVKLVPQSAQPQNREPLACWTQPADDEITTLLADRLTQKASPLARLVQGFDGLGDYPSPQPVLPDGLDDLVKCSV